MIPAAGLGFKPQHLEDAIASPAAGLWFEVHAENYMVEGGPRLAMLETLRETRPISIHGVGLSLGGADAPDPGHLRRLKQLVDRFQPMLVSEHLAWSRFGAQCFPDLLPVPRTSDALERMSRNIDIAQACLGRRILIENPSLYIAFEESGWSETDFLGELVKRTGCGLLIDVNNAFVSANNLGFDPRRYLDAIPGEAVQEVHLAGHSEDPLLGRALLIDSHDAPVAREVWALFGYLTDRIGPRPTLIERDGNVPSFADLMIERDLAERQIRAAGQTAAYA